MDCFEDEEEELAETEQEDLGELEMPERRSGKKMRLEPADPGLEHKQMESRIDALCEYAHVLMHCVLYKINYYNKKTHFDKCLKYNIIVYKCKSEIVCEYISNCVESMRLLMYKQMLDKTWPDKQIFSIGLAVLKAMSDDHRPTNDVNLLIKRYTLQIERLDLDEQGSREIDEWHFRDSILKCLYAKDIAYPKNFKWQIQMRTSIRTIDELNNSEDLFKLFAWRQCDREEVTSISTKSKASFNRISIKPVKTMTDAKMRAQLFIEQPTATIKSSIRN